MKAYIVKLQCGAQITVLAATSCMAFIVAQDNYQQSPRSVRPV